MKFRYFFHALLSTLILTGTYSSAQASETISFSDVATANCLTEFSAWAAIKPSPWEDNDPIMIDASLDQATTDAFNKYVVAAVVMTAHVGSVIRLSNPNFQTQSYFDEAKAQFDLAMCLTLTPTERDLIIEFSLSEKPGITEEKARAAFFEALDKYECSGFAQASREIFQLEPQSDTFLSDYQDALTNMQSKCS